MEQSAQRPSWPVNKDLLLEYTSLFSQAVQCTAGTRGIVYLTVPITSGYRLFRLMQDLGCTASELKERHTDRYREEVLGANLRLAESWSAIARSSFPGRVVLDPSPLTVDGFGQPHYYELWDTVIRTFADTVIATPKWPFSMGSRKEVEMAIASRLRVVDLTGEQYSVEDLQQQDYEARRELHSWGWSEHRITEAIPELVVGEIRDRHPHGVRNEHWNDVFLAVSDDLSYFLGHPTQPVYTAADDDERTRRGLLASDGWYEAKLRRYWDRVVKMGLEDPAGRTELLSLAGASVGMLQSLVRVHGALVSHPEMRRANWYQHPSRQIWSGDYGNRHAVNMVNGEVWTWIHDEHRSMREQSTTTTDDQMTLDFESQRAKAGWVGELWHQYWDIGRNDCASPMGRYRLGQFTTGVMRFLESAVRVYGPIPRRRFEIRR